MRKGLIILLILTSAILCLWSWERALSPMPQAAAATQVGTGRHVALIGEPANVVSVTQAFVAAQAMKPLRTYSKTDAYIREAPPPIGGQVYPPGSIVQLYEVTTDTLHAGQVLSQVVAAAFYARKFAAAAYDSLDSFRAARLRELRQMSDGRMPAAIAGFRARGA